MKKHILLLIALLAPFSSFGCELIMGYRTSERLPLIDKAPNNKGLYQTLYRKAAQQIGCKLIVERGPKKRILKRLIQGKIDFYPGFGFTDKRSKHFYFIENGLHSHSVIVSHRDRTELTSLNQLRNQILLVAHGSRSDLVKQHGAKIRYGQDLSVASALNILEQKKADYFIYNEASINFYLAHNPSPNIKKHYCCFEQEPMYLGFSQYSKHFAAVDNPNYDKQILLSANNTPIALDRASVAYRFSQALKQLQQAGTTKQFEQKYYQLDHDYL